MKKIWLWIFIFLAMIATITGYFCWPLIRGKFNRSKYYTYDELQAEKELSYKKGKQDSEYEEGLYKQQIESYKSILSQYSETIDTLTTETNLLQASVDNLTISLNNANLENNSLREEIRVKTNMIIPLQNQVSNLQTLVNQLNKTNELNLLTISILKNEIQNLNNEIAELRFQLNQQNLSTAELNNIINSLRDSISYYENYIANLETEEQVVITFEFNNSVYNIQIISKGSTLAVNDPVSTDKVIFNYWTVDDEQIDLSTYEFNSNTKVIANITCKNKVEFKVDGVVYNTQYVGEGELLSMPAIPTKEGYNFKGWTLDGVNIIDIDNYQVISDVEFIALFVEVFTVSFISEDVVVSVQEIEMGNYATAPVVESSQGGRFVYWTDINTFYVDVDNYMITKNTVFIAEYSYLKLVRFIDNETVLYMYGVNWGEYCSVPPSPTKENYNFLGWSLDGETIVDLSTTVIYENTDFYAIFEHIPYWQQIGGAPRFDIGNKGRSYTVDIVSCLNNGYSENEDVSYLYNEISSGNFKLYVNVFYCGSSNNDPIKNKEILISSNSLSGSYKELDNIYFPGFKYSFDMNTATLSVNGLTYSKAMMTGYTYILPASYYYIEILR